MENKQEGNEYFTGILNGNEVKCWLYAKEFIPGLDGQLYAQGNAWDKENAEMHTIKVVMDEAGRRKPVQTEAEDTAVYVLEERYYDAERTEFTLKQMRRSDIPQNESTEECELIYDAFETLGEALEFIGQNYY